MSSTKIMEIANGLPMWIACAIPVLFVVFQAVLFLKNAKVASGKLGISEDQVKRAIKSSATTSIGPSIVILSGVLSLLVTVGGPVGWMRLSMIGSVMFESIAAGIGTSAVGVTLGTDTMTMEALTMAVWTMILCSVGWVLFATFSADKMDRVQDKISGGSEKKLIAIASSAIIGVFAAMSATHLSKPIYQRLLKVTDQGLLSQSGKNAFACVLGALIMFVLMQISEKKKIHWLKEWDLTISIILAMVITAFI